MALFKVLRGSSDDFITDLTKANVIPPFNDGFCYFLKDTRMFYIDYAVKDSDGNIIERHRVPLNADDAKTLDNALLIRDKLSDGDNEILSAKLVHTEIARIDNLISTTIGDAITALQNDKMDKVDPTGSGSFSMNGGKATGTNSFAWGDDEKAPDPTEATGLNAFAMGLGSIASGNLSFSRGEYCVASGAYSSADGNAVEATATYAHAEGNNTTASGQGAHAEGEYGVASGKDSHSEGGYTKAQGDYSHSEGYNTTATHKAQHVEGEWNELDPSTNTSANRGVYVHITGIGTGDADRKNGFTVDWSGNLWGARSLGHGNNISASGENSYAGGLNVIASGIASHAEGSNNEAQGMSSHSEGDSTLAEGDYSHAEGFFVKATGVASHAEGRQAEDGVGGEASGEGSHIEGVGAIASNYGSHAEGFLTESSGWAAHAEGQQTIASGTCAHSEGYGTEATKDYSHSGGNNSFANGIGSFAHGLYVSAEGDYSTVFGKYNTLDTNKTLAFAIGNGTADNARKNIFQVAWDGSAYLENRLNIAGLELEQDAAGYTLFVNGPAFFSGTIKAAEPVEANDVTTKNYVDNNLPRMTHSWITATAGQSVFDFATPDDGCVAAADLADYYYAYFNGLLLIPDLHYSVSGSVVTFIGWAAEAGDVCHIVGFKPINPTA